MTGLQESCRIYLMVPSRADVDLEHRLAEIFAGGAVSCALLGCDAHGRVDRSLAARLVASTRDRDVALLFESDVEAAAALGADGVHIEADAQHYDAARRALGGNAVVGAGCGLSRHRAMVLGEQGADYVAFGTPDSDIGSQHDSRQESLIAWWAELFEVPCVAWDAGDVAAAVHLAGRGADFVAIRHAFWNHADAPADALADLADALAKTRSAA